VYEVGPCVQRHEGPHPSGCILLGRGYLQHTSSPRKPSLRVTWLILHSIQYLIKGQEGREIHHAAPDYPSHTIPLHPVLRQRAFCRKEQTSVHHFKSCSSETYMMSNIDKILYPD
jgi:hypothetical protein